MHRFNINFSNDELSRKVGQRMKDQIADKLLSAGLAERVKVSFVENEHGIPINFDFEGSSDDVAKAKEALGIAPQGSEDERKSQ